MSERTAQEQQAITASRGQHIPEFDVMRGAAIIFVVYLHSYFSPWEVSPRREVVAMHVVHLFAHTAVPVFFFISAFLLSRDSRSSFGALLGRKARRIAVPLLFWMFASLVFRVWKEGALTGGMVKSFLLFDISGQFYFVIVLLVFTVAFHFVSDWSVVRLRWLTIAAFAANLGTIVYYQSSSLQGDFSTLAYRNPLTWVFFFSYGFYVGRSRGTLGWTRRYLAPALLGMAALVAIYLAAGERGDYPVSYFGVTVFLFGCLSLVAYPALVQLVTKPAAGRLAVRPLTALSGYAFAIYLVHVPFFIGTGSIADNLISADSRFNTDFFKLMNALFVVGFVGSLLFVFAVARVAPTFADEFMGIEPRRKPT